MAKFAAGKISFGGRPPVPVLSLVKVKVPLVEAMMFVNVAHNEGSRLLEC